MNSSQNQTAANRQTTGATEPRKQSMARGIAAATIGNALEWYDMSIYALLAIYIGHNFFPSDNPAVEVIQAFAVFGVSYLIRPLGGLLLGSYADRRGMKKGLMLTIRLMVLGTAVIAFMPGYDAIGILAPLGLILGRLIQGFSAGGEFGAATSYLIAQGEGRRGFLGSFQFASQGLGALMAAVTVVVLTTVFNEAEMNAWAWRIPFIIGLLVGPAGWMIRRYVDEAPLAEVAPEEKHTPIRDVFVSQKAGVLMAGGALAISTALNFVIQYMPTFGIKQLGISPSISFTSLILTGLILTFFTPVVGHLSDRFGRIRIMVPAAITIAVLTIPLFMWLIAGRTFLVLALVMIILGLMKSVYFGALPSVMADVFPPKTRATGLSFSYNTAVAVFGGFTPMICAYLIEVTGQPMAPSYYLAVLAGVSLVALASAMKYRGVR